MICALPRPGGRSTHGPAVATPSTRTPDAAAGTAQRSVTPAGTGALQLSVAPPMRESMLTSTGPYSVGA